MNKADLIDALGGRLGGKKRAQDAIEAIFDVAGSDRAHGRAEAPSGDRLQGVRRRPQDAAQGRLGLCPGFCGGHGLISWPRVLPLGTRPGPPPNHSSHLSTAKRLFF